MKKKITLIECISLLTFFLFTLSFNSLQAQGLDCPADIVVEATAVAGVCTANVSVIALEDATCAMPNPMNDSPFAADNNSLDASGEYPVGTTIVNFSTCDGANTCSVSVTVTKPAPICSTQDITVYLDASGTYNLSPLDVDDNSEDPCDGPLTISVSPSAFSCMEIGSNDVLFTATNSEGLMCSTTASVFVEDTISPTLVANDLTVYLDEDGLAEVDVMTVDNGSSDNCGTPTLSLTVNEQTCDDILKGGTVTVLLEDDNGNTTIVDLPVTVIDTIPPEVDEVEDIDITLEPSDCLGPVSYELPVPVDNCDIPISLTQNLDNSVVEESLSCAIGTMVHYYRIFDMSNSAVDVVIDNINIGVFNSFNNPTVDVKIHELDGDFLMANLTEIASNSMVLGDLNLEFIDYPISATLSNKIYVVEIIAPNFSDNGFIVGANYQGETAPSYFASASCGFPEPQTNAQIGFPTISVLMTLETTNTYLVEQLEGIASDSIFPPGTTTNVFEYTDASGNATQISFDVNVEEYQVEGLSCLTEINLSIDAETCVSSLTPEMVLTTELIGCPDDCTITIMDEDENVFENLFTKEDVGLSYMYQVCCGGNCCMGTVNIEDKTPPQIECTNDTITCGEFLNFPYPLLTENCTDEDDITYVLLNETIVELSCDDPLLQQIIIREFQAIDEAGNESNICSQELSISKFDIGTVDPPLLTEINIECGTDYPMDDQGRPDVSVYGGPRLNGQELALNQALVCNLLVTFNDQTIQTGSNSFSIVRTFDATVWYCGQDTSSQFVQVFNIGDNQGPIITCSSDLTFSSDGFDCGSSIELPALPVVDICGQLKSVAVQYEGGFINGNGGIADLSLGTSTVTYIATDTENNISECTFNVTVIDDIQPNPVCDQFTVVSLTNEGYAIVDAEEFDDGSFDACGDVTIEVRRMNPKCDSDDFFFGESVTFCCDDIGVDQMIVLRVTDEAGNFNKCMVTAEVQDKTPPSLIQGLPDITLACDFPFNVNDTEQFGTIQTQLDDVEEILLTSDVVEFSGPAFDGLVLGGCLELQSDEFSFSNINSCGVGNAIRVITFTNSQGMTVSDVQSITFVNPSPFSYDDIQFPADITLFNVCDISDIPATMPVFVEDGCDQVGIEVVDQVIDNSNGSESCYKILRTFTLLDWCQNDGGTFELFEGTQVILVNNTIAPEITSSCENVSICSYDNSCGDAFIDLNLEATDDCTTSAFLNYTYLIDAFSDGSIDITGNSSSASGAYPVGIHTIYWTVNDACGNEDMCSYTFEIENCKTPTPYCLDNLTAGLTAMDLDGDGDIDTEMIMITPDFFDAGSFHVCGTPVQLSFSADVNDTERMFNCNDLGEQPIQLWVTDENGNQDFCATSVVIQDNNDIEFCTEMLVFDITGVVKNSENMELTDVEVSLGVPELMELTNEEGLYSFIEMPLGNEYVVSPSNDVNPTNGITVSDIILIQKHILGLEPLTSPYQLIAADVDNSTKVNGQDILQIRKLLLGHYEAFPMNESWKFIDAKQVFIDNSNPWFDDLVETVHIPNLEYNVVADFIGVKVGDVNETATNGITGNGIDTRTDVVLEMEVSAVDLVKEEISEIELYNSSSIEPQGIQLGLTYDQSAIEVLNVTIGGKDATDSQVNINKGNLRILLSDEEVSQSIKITVKAKRDLKQSTLKLDDSVLFNMAYAQNEGEIKVELNEDVLVVEPTEEYVFELNQNEPNPWMNSTNIQFVSTRNGKGKFRVMNTNGKVIVNRELELQKGNNSIVLSSEELPSSGIYYYEVSMEDTKMMKKMILIK